MRVKRVAGDLADPAAPAWSETESEAVGLAPVPLDAQPTEYIRNAWAGRAYGTVIETTVAAASDGERLFVRLEWADSATPNTEFHDAAAVFFPGSEDAPAATIGAAGAPVNLWYWQADLEAARDLEARGPGVFAKRAGGDVSSAAALSDGRWAVVLSGGLAAAGGSRLGVAVWDGSNEERAGIGAATREWIPVEIES